MGEAPACHDIPLLNTYYFPGNPSPQTNLLTCLGTVTVVAPADPDCSAGEHKANSPRPLLHAFHTTSSSRFRKPR